MKKLIFIVLSFFWMGIIFYNSSNDGPSSNKKSYAIVKVIEKAKAKTINLHNKSSKDKQSLRRRKKMNVFIRKNFHFIEYLVLAIFIGILIFACGYKEKDIVVYILFICLLYAVTDEFHQKFVPGRSSDVGDVLIDFLGAVVGTSIYYFVYYNSKLRASLSQRSFGSCEQTVNKSWKMSNYVKRTKRSNKME